ncbi:MAG: hypothetical protein ACI85I_000429 [Arenicella sp.]|jgi:hypothetical protein
MSIAKKIKFGVLTLFGFFVCWILSVFLIEDYKEAKFHNIEIPTNLKFEKPIEFLTYRQIDSLKNTEINEAKILLIGSGYSGYSFYMWHQPTEKGEIYIKVFELTQNIQLSELDLRKRTTNKISELSNGYKLYKGKTVIGEGTFENYYPTRFELWFKSKNSRIENKLAEKKYLIDGWDR